LAKTQFFKMLVNAIAWSAFGGVSLLVFAGIYYLQSRPPLKIWHSTYLEGEFTAASNFNSFAEYRDLEQKLFKQLDEKIIKMLPEKDKSVINRFTAGSLSDPAQWKQNWNESFFLPASQPGGPGVLLLHGMSDSPYSLRTIGTLLHAQGFSVLGLRLPGHGTVPSGLVNVKWEDMAAAVKLAMQHLHQLLDGKPVYIVGYSNGAALAVNYSLSALTDRNLPKPAGLALLSPQIRITAVAALAKWQSLIGWAFDLRQLAWNSLQPEYDPFKYNSFAVNAGQQSFEITGEIQSKLTALAEAGLLKNMPEILAFQSVADATIIPTGIIDGLLKRLPSNNHHLVLFDINRQSKSLNSIVNDPIGPIENSLAAARQAFALTLISNRLTGGNRVASLHKKAGETAYQDQMLDLEWPPDVYSLSHVALPFRGDDPLYGGIGDGDENGVKLGRMDFRGERGVLQIPPGDILRQRWNPFFSFMMSRISDFLQPAKPN
jgi:pimeloyl-ACP methyl ester carboxylesterase